MERIFLYPSAGPGGRNYIKTIGTRQDIDFNGLELNEGMRLSFYCDDANDAGQPDDPLFDGIVHFDTDKQQWYVLIDEGSYHHASDLRNPIRKPDA